MEAGMGKGPDGKRKQPNLTCIKKIQPLNERGHT